MNPRFIPRDERTVAVENASYRWAYLFLSFGILLSVVYRSFILEQSSWDLLALVVLSGGVTMIYQGIYHIVSWRWALVAVLTMLSAAVIGVALMLVR